VTRKRPIAVLAPRAWQICLLLAVLGTVALPWRAGAQTTTSSPFSPGVPLSPVTTPSTSTPTLLTATNATSGGGGLSGSNALVITIGAVVVLTAIALFIWRDARRRAPVRRRSPGAAPSGDGRGRPGSAQRTKPRKLSPAERRRRKRGRAKR
jgi:hypothetical protein